ncbi:MAG: hypothetical protein LBS12_05600, partial [Prevotellaceae bacterium]|nr:hypothetical protein [Prevotellaceae bacterium]
PGPRVVKIHFQAAGSEHKAKPHGIHGVEIIWQVFDTPSPSVSIDELIHSEFDTMTPYEFRFSDAQRGKRLYFAMRWENTTGAKGPWSEIMEAIIP